VGQRDLPLANGSAHVKAFSRAGWVCAKKKAKDAHFILGKEGETSHLSIPDHREVKRALLQKQIQHAGLTEAEYIAFFNQ